MRDGGVAWGEQGDAFRHRDYSVFYQALQDVFPHLDDCKSCPVPQRRAVWRPGRAAPAASSQQKFCHVQPPSPG